MLWNGPLAALALLVLALATLAHAQVPAVANSRTQEVVTATQTSQQQQKQQAGVNGTSCLSNTTAAGATSTATLPPPLLIKTPAVPTMNVPMGPKAQKDAIPTYIGEMTEETGFYQSIRLGEGNPVLYETQSDFQNIQVVQSQAYGKILVLDGVVQLTERDADSYNEMMAHIPLFAHPNPQRVLVVGGGDGYVVSEVLKHASVQHVDHVDLDGGVIQTCQEHFPWGQAAWDDPRVHLHVADGAAFVRNAPANSYDVIIQDSSDPWTWADDGSRVVLPSSVLYSTTHFSNLQRILKSNGILNLQAETLNIPSDLEGIREWRQQATAVGFAQARYGSLMISSYPTGQIGFLLCQNAPGPGASAESMEQRYQTMIATPEKATTYYHPPLQTSSFILPLWAEKYIYSDAVNGDEDERTAIIA